MKYGYLPTRPDLEFLRHCHRDDLDLLISVLICDPKLVTANELAKKYGAWLVEGKDPQQELEQQRLAEQHIMQLHR